MKIAILGTRGEIDQTSDIHAKHSGILIDHILFDLGEKEYLDLKPEIIFLTHLHPDHAFFVKDKKGLSGWNTYIVAPEKAPEGLEGFDYKNWEIMRYPKDSDFRSFTIKAIPTTHSKLVKSQGYLIEGKGKRVLYTGDMIWINKKYHDQLKDLDLVITDGSFAKTGGMIRRDKKTEEIYGHQGIPNIINFFAKLGAKRIIFTHFGSDIVKMKSDEAEVKMRDLAGTYKNVEIAKDGMEINLSSLSEDLTKSPCVPGIDYDIEHSKKQWKQLNADHRYLHIGYIHIKDKKAWGEWSLDSIARCHAKIVDAMRKLYFPYIVSGTDKKFMRELDLKSKEFEKTEPPKTPEEQKIWADKRKEIFGREALEDELQAITAPEVAPITPKIFAKKVETPARGLYLIEPHARWISEGYKTATVKSKKYEVKPDEVVFLLGDHLCYGEMLIGQPIEISLEEFKKFENEHRIDEKTRKAWCTKYSGWCKGPLYLYHVKMISKFKPPKPVTLPQGIQNWVDIKSIKFEEIKALPNNIISRLHAMAHVMKNLEFHEILVKEYESRGISHSYLNWFDRIQEFLIKDWKTYDAKELIKTPRGRKVILDDHRIVHAWWHLLLKGKKMESPQFKDYNLEEQKKIVRGLYDKIAEAMKSLGWKPSPLSLSKLSEKCSLELTIEELQSPDEVVPAWIEIEEIDFKLHVLKGRMLLKDGKIRGQWRLSPSSEQSIKVLLKEKTQLKAFKCWVSGSDILDVTDSV